MKTSIKLALKRASKKQEEKRNKMRKRTLEDTALRDRTIGAFPTYVFTASISSDYHLRDNFLLDTTAGAHVCNNRARFYDLRPATEDDYPYAGNTVIPIEGFGLLDIDVKIPGGSANITLLKAALVPSFHTSVVSMDKLLAKKAYWDMENNRLTHNKQTFCYVERHHRQWTLEYNEPSEPTGKWNALLPGKWHLKLGHAGPEAIAHLSEAATGAKLIRVLPLLIAKLAVLAKLLVLSLVALLHAVLILMWDLIQMSKAYNGDKWISNMRCDRTCMNHVYTQRSKKQSLPTMQRFVKWAYRRYGCVIRSSGWTVKLPC
jgi:hypothetical protein